MATTTTTSTTRLRSASTMTALAAIVALVSTGCTQAEVNNLLTLLRVLGWFI